MIYKTTLHYSQIVFQTLSTCPYYIYSDYKDLEKNWMIIMSQSSTYYYNSKESLMPLPQEKIIIYHHFD